MLDLNAEITKLFSEFKDGRWSCANNRINYVDSLIERYFTERGKVPPKQDLDRLATFILLEELSDTSRGKMSESEYPTMSARMERGRQELEAPFEHSSQHGMDGQNYRKPTRIFRKK